MSVAGERLPIQSLNFGLDSLGIGVWDIDLINGEINWDDRCKDLFGLCNENNPTFDQVVSYIHPDDRERALQVVATAMDPASGGKYDVKYRTLPGIAGIMHLVRSTGKVSFDENNVPFRFAGIVVDITEELESFAANARVKEELNDVKKRLSNNEQRLKSIFEQAPVAIAILRGREMTIEAANDGILAAWCRTNEIIGLPIAEALPEIEAQGFLQQLQNVYDSGTPFFGNAVPANMEHDGIQKKAYYDFVFTPLKNTDGAVDGLMVVAIDVTLHVEYREKIKESEGKLRTTIDHIPTLAWIANADGWIYWYNKRWYEYTGTTPEDMEGWGWQSVHDAEELPKVMERWQLSIANGTPFEMTFPLKGADGNFRHFLTRVVPFYDSEQKVYEWLGTNTDVTTEIEAKQKLEESETKLRAIIDQAPMAIGVLRGRDMIIESGNDTIFAIWGKDRSVTGQTITDALPEIKNQGFLELLQHVYDTGVPYYGYEQLVQLMHNDVLTDVYVDFSYSPLKDSAGIANGILVLATDITARALAKQKIEASEAKFRSFIEKTPVATAVFTGKDLVIEIANSVMLGYWKKGAGVIGMPYKQAVPELEGQGYFDILDDIFRTGRDHHEYASRADIVDNGVTGTYYFNYSYTPLFDEHGAVYAVLNMGIDVTEQVRARQKLEEAATEMQGVMNMANLANWSMDIKTKTFTYSDRFMEWLGFDERTKSLDEAYNPLPDEFRQLVPEKINEAIVTGVYDNEHPIINRLTGHVRIIHAQANVFYDEDGAPLVLRGTAQDITEQRNIELALQNLVTERTIALQKSNKELAAINEELADSVEQLNRSNEELSQYAYVASHDLQEPLRKILVFSDLLEKQEDLSDKSRDVAMKISTSSRRMSLLIKSLLEFSRLLNSDAMTRPVNLKHILNDVITDFELTIEEKDAEIILTNTLPELVAVPLQMNQLFYNLIGNALKFSKKDVRPVINIACEKLTAAEVKQYLKKHSSEATYYDITIADNGIGFDTAYSEQIFEVFKRLHTRDAYPGSGIGLALCRKIVINHGGVLYAESQPEKGSTFHIILPGEAS